MYFGKKYDSIYKMHLEHALLNYLVRSTAAAVDATTTTIKIIL